MVFTQRLGVLWHHILCGSCRDFCLARIFQKNPIPSNGKISLRLLMLLVAMSMLVGTYLHTAVLMVILLGCHVGKVKGICGFEIFFLPVRFEIHHFDYNIQDYMRRAGVLDVKY